MFYIFYIGTTKTILHVDLDAFFASMEIRRKPHLKGMPVIVGTLENRGVVSTCNYEARAFGIHSGISTIQAHQLCPTAIFLPSDIDYYAKASKQFHAILLRYTPLHQPYGYDEAFLDMRGTKRLFGTPEMIAKLIRNQIQDEIGITASIGIASNHVVAKIASNTAKPNGMISIRTGAEATFLAPLALRNLPMVGPKMEQVLKRLGLTTIGDLANFPRELLIERLGKTGGVLHDRAQGIDLNPIFPKRKKVKTISRETTFNLDEASRLKLRATIRSQSEKISRDLSNNQQGGRTITIKIRSAPFETSLRSTTSNEQFTNSDQIFDRATKLFENLWSECGYKPLRLIGIGITNLSPVAQQLQFGGQLSILESNVSKLRQRYGERIIVRASELGNSHKK